MNSASVLDRVHLSNKEKVSAELLRIIRDLRTLREESIEEGIIDNTLIGLFGEIEAITTTAKKKMIGSPTGCMTVPLFMCTAFQNIIDAIPCGVFWKDTNLVYSGCNHRFAIQAGLDSPRDILYKTARDLPRNLEGPKFDQIDREILERGISMHGVEESKEKLEGDSFALLTSKVPLLGTNGEVAGILGVFFDITELKNIEKDLRQRVEKTRSGMSDIAQQVLHNIGNVLNSVNTSTSMIYELSENRVDKNLDKAAGLLRSTLEDFRDHPDIVRKMNYLALYLEENAMTVTEKKTAIFQELKDLQKYIQHMNDVALSHLKFAKPVSITNSVEITEVISTSLNIFSSELEENRIQVKTSLHELPMIFSDKHKILQILLNLISNAIHAIKSKGDHERRIEITANKTSEDFVTIIIEDNGVGISPEVINKVFLFGYTSKRNGFGLGLHSSANIAIAIGGTLQVSSHGVGKGACFTLMVPIRLQTPIADQTLFADRET